MPLSRSRLTWIWALIVFAAAAAFYGFSRNQAPPRPNLLLITLDTTRADRIGCYGYQAARTPVLDQLARDGILFEKAYSPIPLTLPSHASMMTGLYPPEHGLRTNGSGSLPAARTTFAELLVRAGYDAGAFVASFVLDGKFGLKQGFQVYDDNLIGAEPTQDAIHRNRDGKLVVDAALQWLNKPRAKPFFCWVHLYDPHAPYDPRSQEFDHAFDGNPYDGELAYTDRLVGRLLEFVQQHPRTLVIVVGDHGESLGDHSEIQHGYTLYNATQHVPLIIHGASDSTAGTRVPTPVSLVDLFPTMLELLELPVPKDISGRNLTAAVRGAPLELRPCYGMTDDPFLQNGWSPLRSVTTDRWRYIKTAVPELYDLAADPQELHNLAASEPERCQELGRQLADLESALVVGEADAVQLSAKDLKALQGLGYVGGVDQGQAAPAENTLPDVKVMLPFNVRTQAAIDFIDQGKFDDAEPILRQIVADSPPEHYASRLYLGSVYEHQGKFDQAEEIYLGVLKLRPDDTNALFHLGGLYAEQARYAEAIPIFERSRDAEPDSAQPLYNLGLAKARLGEFDEAQRYFEEGLQIDPAFPGLWFNLGNVLTRKGRTADAIAAYEAELELNPKSVEAHVNLGSTFGQQQRWDGAKLHLEEAVRLVPDSSDFRYNLALCLGMMGNHDEAADQLRELIQRNPDAPNSRTALGNTLLKLKRIDEAERAFLDEVERFPEALEARVNLGALLGQQAKWAEAQRQLDEAARLAPDNADVQFNLGICADKLGAKEQAERHLQAALRLNPNHRQAAAELARLRGK